MMDLNDGEMVISIQMQKIMQQKIMKVMKATFSFPEVQLT